MGGYIYEMFCFTAICLLVLNGAFVIEYFFPSNPKKVGLYMRGGWKAPLMFYRFKCKLHGWVVNHSYGYAKRLECPICVEEKLKNEA